MNYPFRFEKITQLSVEKIRSIICPESFNCITKLAFNENTQVLDAVSDFRFIFLIEIAR